MTLALLHGFTGAPSDWELPGIKPALLGHAPDLLRPSTWDAEIDRLAALLAPAAPLHLVGYSMGARVALGLLVAHPALAAAATLIGVNPGLDAAERPARLAEEARWLALLERGIAPFVDAWEAQPLLGRNAAAERARRLAHDPAGLAFALAALGLGRMPDLRPALSRVRCPVTLVAGSDDPRFRALAADTARRLPRASVAVVDGAGHNVPRERPRALAALLHERPSHE